MTAYAGTNSLLNLKEWGKNEDKSGQDHVIRKTRV